MFIFLQSDCELSQGRNPFYTFERPLGLANTCWGKWWCCGSDDGNNYNGYFLKGKLLFIMNRKGRAAKTRSQVNFERELSPVMTQRCYQRQTRLGLHSKQHWAARRYWASEASKEGCRKWRRSLWNADCTELKISHVWLEILPEAENQDTVSKVKRKSSFQRGSYIN